MRRKDEEWKSKELCAGDENKYINFMCAMEFFYCPFLRTARSRGYLSIKKKLLVKVLFSSVLIHLFTYPCIYICSISNVIFCLNFSIYPLHYGDVRLASTISTTPGGRLEAANCWCSPWCSFYIKKNNTKTLLFGV